MSVRIYLTCHNTCGDCCVPAQVLMRWNAELKAVYSHYSMSESADFSHLADGDTGRNERESFTMNVGQFWRFARDCFLVDAGFPLAGIDRCLLDVSNAHARAVSCAKRRAREGENPSAQVGPGAATPGAVGAKDDIADVHDSRRAILFREFVEGLVRISYVRGDGYGLADGTSTRGVPALASLLSRLLQQHVQKYAGGVTRRDGPPAAKEDPLRSIVETDATVRSVLKEFDADLRGAYASVASAGRDRSATMRDFLRLFCDSGVLGERASVSLSSAMRFLGQAYQFPDANATDVLCVECIFPDFVDAIVRMAQMLLQNGAEDGAGLAHHVRDVAGRIVARR